MLQNKKYSRKIIWLTLFLIYARRRRHIIIPNTYYRQRYILYWKSWNIILHTYNDSPLPTPIFQPAHLDVFEERKGAPDERIKRNQKWSRMWSAVANLFSLKGGYIQRNGYSRVGLQSFFLYLIFNGSLFTKTYAFRLVYYKKRVYGCCMLRNARYLFVFNGFLLDNCVFIILQIYMLLLAC